jgi:formylglycine-generating enzyme required for sulfatase activity
MARMIVVLSLLSLACCAQDDQFKLAGVCGRCHVISVVEWSMSKHRMVGTGCTECHGVSKGHVIDERNNIKPDKLPREQAIAPFCNSCHEHGCLNTKKKSDCQSCHHVHALVDPNRPAKVSDVIAPAQTPVRPPPVRSDLPRKITVAGFDMVLVEAGEFDMGSDRWPNAKPVHTVRVDPFYIGAAEVTAAQWRAVMKADAAGGAAGAVSNVSWLDCQEFVRRLNAGATGAGLRLPTEAEWEFAARHAAALSLAHMFDGVWEWTASDYRPYLDPDATDRKLKVLRGGSDADTLDLRDAAFRHGERPARRLRWNGIRLAREARVR